MKFRTFYLKKSFEKEFIFDIFFIGDLLWMTVQL